MEKKSNLKTIGLAARPEGMIYCLFSITPTTSLNKRMDFRKVRLSRNMKYKQFATERIKRKSTSFQEEKNDSPLLLFVIIIILLIFSTFLSSKLKKGIAYRITFSRSILKVAVICFFWFEVKQWPAHACRGLSFPCFLALREKKATTELAYRLVADMSFRHRIAAESSRFI